MDFLEDIRAMQEAKKRVGHPAMRATMQAVKANIAARRESVPVQTPAEREAARKAWAEERAAQEALRLAETHSKRQALVREGFQAQTRFWPLHVDAVTSGRVTAADFEPHLTILREVLAAKKCAVIVGDFGNGKTNLAAFAAMQAMTEPPWPKWRYWTARELYSHANALMYGGPKRLEEADVMTQILSPDVVVIDEFQELSKMGAESGVKSFLGALIDRIYGHYRPVVIISNQKPGEFVKEWGERVTDRLRERGKMIVFTGESHRRKSE